MDQVQSCSFMQHKYHKLFHLSSKHFYNHTCKTSGFVKGLNGKLEKELCHEKRLKVRQIEKPTELEVTSGFLLVAIGNNIKTNNSL